MQNLIAVVILGVIIGLAGRYVYKAKKTGQKCIGCPNGACPYRNGGCSGSCGQTDEK